MNTLEIASIGLRDDVDRMRLLGHNVANLTTPGYKRQVSVGSSFPSMMQPPAEAPSASGPTVHTDIARGKLRASGGALDLALGEREFLVVQQANGELALSRGGSLQLDAQGRLTTREGLAVQEAKGSLTASSVAANVRLDSTGHLVADDKQLGLIRVVSVPPGTKVTSMGDGLFDTKDIGQLPTLDSVTVQTGHVEVSNVIVSQEMVQIMTTMRHAEAMVKLIQGADEMLEKAIRKFGDMS